MRLSRGQRHHAESVLFLNFVQRMGPSTQPTALISKSGWRFEECHCLERLNNYLRPLFFSQTRNKTEIEKQKTIDYLCSDQPNFIRYMYIEQFTLTLVPTHKPVSRLAQKV